MLALQVRSETGSVAGWQAARPAYEMRNLIPASRLFAQLAKTDETGLHAEATDFRNAQDVCGAVVALAPIRHRESEEEVCLLSKALVQSAIFHERSGDLLDAHLDYLAASMLFPDDTLINHGLDRTLRQLAKAVQTASPQDGRPGQQLMRLARVSPRYRQQVVRAFEHAGRLGLL